LAEDFVKSKPALADFHGGLGRATQSLIHRSAHGERHHRAAAGRLDGCRALINSGSSQDRQHPEGGVLPSAVYQLN
jgi:hypothetical protein